MENCSALCHQETNLELTANLYAGTVYSTSVYSSAALHFCQSLFAVIEYQCVGFPGPGVSDPMSENPFFEFVGAPSYTHIDKQKKVETEFKHFSQKHDKQYENDQEVARRKSIFNHNYRYAVLACVSTYIVP